MDKKKNDKDQKEHDDKKKTEELEKTKEELTNQLKRSLADYQNLTKRIEENKLEWSKMANKQLLLRLLPGIDALLLAEKHTKDEGIRLSIDHFLKILEQDGVKKIESVGKDFDPNIMECVNAVETDLKEEDGKVIEELRPGTCCTTRF